MIMKKIFFPALLLLLCFGFTVKSTSLTKAERKFAAGHLKDTKKHLLKAIKGLSAAQLNFKASPDSWSITECTEHIAISENMLFGMFDGVLKTTPDPAKRGDVKMTDEQVIALITDRSNKVQTQEPFKPTGKFGSHEGAVTEFVTKRDEHIKRIKKIQDDLRNRYQQLPFGIIDGYQVILFISAHTERHIKQIEEVKAHPNFPKG
jgi:DinB superfamily